MEEQLNTNVFLDMLLEHYEDGKWSYDEDEKAVPQVKRNKRCQLKKQVLEFINVPNNRRTMFIQALIDLMNETQVPERMRKDIRRLRQQLKVAETKYEQELEFEKIQARDKVKEEMKKEYEEKHKEDLATIRSLRERMGTYRRIEEDLSNRLDAIKRMKIITPDEYSLYTTKKAELQLLGLWDENTPIKDKLDDKMDSSNPKCKKYKKQIRKLQKEIMVLKAQLSSSSSSGESSCEED